MAPRKKKDNHDPIGEWDTWQKNRYIEGFYADKVMQEGQLLPKYTSTPKANYKLLNILYLVSFIVLAVLALYSYSRYFIPFIAALAFSIVSVALLVHQMAKTRKLKKNASKSQEPLP